MKEGPLLTNRYDANTVSEAIHENIEESYAKNVHTI